MDQNHPHHAAYVRIGILATAVLLTVAFHFLVAERWFGLGLAIFAILLIIGIHIIDVLAVKPNNTWAYVFLVPLLTCAAAECMYSSSVVRGLALWVMIASAALFAYWFSAPRIGFWEAPVLWPATAIRESVWPFKGLGNMTSGWTKTERLRKILIGLVIAAPVVLIVGALFARADAVFGKVLSGFFQFDEFAFVRSAYRTIRDIVVVLFFIAFGWTVYTRVSESRKARAGATPTVWDHTVVATFLGVLNLLFLVFIAFQIAAFFGGEAYVQAHGISYADHARDGFFQLLAVAGIVFAIILAVYRSTHLRQWASRLLSIALIVETGVVIASAVRRLLLYIDAYGLTVSRYWAMVVILIIAAVLFIFLVGALMKIRYEPMIKSVFIGWLVILPLLFLINVNGYIVKFNFDRFVSGKTDRLDTKYFSDWDISSDAVPEIVAALRADWPASPRVNGFDKINLYGSLSRKMEELQKVTFADWRKAVISDYRAMASFAAIGDIDPAALIPGRSVGNVDSPDYVRLSKTSGYAFPKEINGYLSTSTNIMKDTLFFPSRVAGKVTVIMEEYRTKGTLNLPIDDIGGDLAVKGIINKFETMPKHIGGDLDLSQAEVNAPLPAGLDIDGAVAVPQYDGQTSNELAKDAYAKGYSVRYIPVPPPLDKAALVPPCGSDMLPCPVQPTPPL